MAEVASLQQLVSPQVVAFAFIQQYVHIQQKCPGLLHRFYDEVSKLGRPNDDGTFSVTTTMQGINEKILSMHYEDCRTEIQSVDAQDSHNGGVHVLVTGRMVGTDNVIKNFAQTFFLAPQKNGYFVLNDMFRYLDDKKHNYQDHRATSDLENVKHSNQDQRATCDMEALPIVGQVHPVQDNHVSEQTPAKEEVNEKELKEESDHLHNGVHKQEEEMPVAEVHEFERSSVVVDEVPDNSHVVVDEEPENSHVVVNEVPENLHVVVDDVPENSHVVESNIEEEPRKSYASIVMDMKGHSMPLSPPSPQKPIKKSQEPQANLAQAPISGAQTPVPVLGSIDNVNNQEGEAEGYSIYVKGLLWSVTPAQLRDVFSEFGPIKSDGIQVVKTNTQLRFCYGFVEFEVESAAQKAIEASPIEICGYHAYIEEKRSTYYRGHHRARLQADRGSGYRNEEVRGRGNYGNNRVGNGRYYPNPNRSEFNYNRGNYQGGLLKSEVDGYHKMDNYGRGGGGRFSRGNGMVSNSADKTAPIRIPAKA